MRRFCVAEGRPELPPNPERHPDIRCDEHIGAAESIRRDANDCIRLAVNLQRAADKIATATHAFPESIARYYDWNICVRSALLRRVKAAAPCLHAHEREVILRGQKRETAPHVVIAADAGHCKIDRAYIGKHIFTVLAQLTEFIVRKLAIIVRGILAGGEYVDHLGRAQWHHRAQHDAVDQRENGGVNTDSQRQGQYCDSGEAWCLQQLSNGKFEILNHRRSISLRLFIEMRSIGDLDSEIFRRRASAPSAGRASWSNYLPGRSCGNTNGCSKEQ